MKSTTKPTISVIIPTHNRHELFRKCLASVMCQKTGIYKLQIIVIDESSSPPIRSVISEKVLPKIKIIRNKRALGPSIARTQGLQYAKGQIIAFLDSDDFWRKDFLSQTISHIRPHTSQIITTLVWPIFIGNISVSNKITFSILSSARVLTLMVVFLMNRRLVPYQLLYFLRLSSCVFTREAIGNSKFLMAYRTAEDWKFYYDCIKNNKPRISILPKILVDVTYSGQSETVRRSHYWGYYYKLIDEMPSSLRNSPGIKLFRKYTDWSVWRNKSEKFLHYVPKTK